MIILIETLILVHITVNLFTGIFQNICQTLFEHIKSNDMFLFLEKDFNKF